MKKARKTRQATLELKKESLVNLSTTMLREVMGGHPPPTVRNEFSGCFC